MLFPSFSLVSVPNMHQEFKKIGREEGVVEHRNKYPPLGCPSHIYEGLVLQCMAYERLERPLFHQNGDVRRTVEELIEGVMCSAKT